MCVCAWEGEDGGFSRRESLQRSASEVSDIDSPKFPCDEGLIPAIPEARACIDCERPEEHGHGDSLVLR